MTDDAFRGFALHDAIAKRARASGIVLAPDSIEFLVSHARAVLEANERLRLTTITEPEAFVERHLGESFEGAALLDEALAGCLVDLGSGNGYPGLVIAAARPGLSPLLVEAARRKAEFLRGVLSSCGRDGEVLERQVQRAADLPAGEAVVVTSRAVGNWERILPRLRGALAPQGRVLVWAGEEVESVRGRTSWRHYVLAERRALPGRSHSWIWEFRLTQ